MSQSNNISWFWALIIVVLLGITGWNIYQKKQFQEHLISQSQALKTSVALEEYQELVSMSLKHTGKYIEWPETLQSIGGTYEEVAAPKLIMAFSQKSCNSCRDSETRFAIDMAHKIGVENVRLVIHGESQRYVRGYMASLGIEIPVLFDEDGSFFEKNGIEKSPVSLLVNERGEVLAGHFPAPLKEVLSEPFRKTVANFFDVEPYKN